MKIDRRKVRGAFDAYVSDFDADDGKIKLKIDHTYRVADLCSRIAESLSLDKEETDLAWLLGMLHDIGRFRQIREYGTFIDSRSIDHALCGTQVLFDDGSIRSFILSEEEDALIYHAIRYHNAFRLPKHSDGRTLMFSNLLRDADKIDILKVNVETPFTVIYGPESSHAKYEAISEEVLRDYMEEHAVLRSHNRTYADYIVGHASLVFELVYPESLRIVQEQGYLDKILNFDTENETAKEQFIKIRKRMEQYLAARK